MAYAPHRRVEPGRVARTGRRLFERGVVQGFRALSRTLNAVPLRASLPVARTFFLAGYHAWPQKRRIMLSNASHVLGKPERDREVRTLARRMYRTYADFSVELMRLPHLPVDEPARLMTDAPEGGGTSFVELQERVRAAGRGVIVVSGHIGSIDTLAAAFAARGVPVYGVADDSAFPELLALLGEQRRRWGVGVIPWRNLRLIYRVLRERAVLGLVVDWGYRIQDVPVRLFGAWTTLPAGPAVLAARTGALLLPVVNRRLPDGRYAARHFEQIDVGSGTQADIAYATQAIADALERMIAEGPEQWYTFKPMWPATIEEARALEERWNAMVKDQPPGGPTPDGPGSGGAS